MKILLIVLFNFIGIAKLLAQSKTINIGQVPDVQGHILIGANIHMAFGFASTGNQKYGFKNHIKYQRAQYYLRHQSTYLI